MNSEGRFTDHALRAAFRARYQQERIDQIEFYILVGLIVATAVGFAFI